MTRSCAARTQLHIVLRGNEFCKLQCSSDQGSFQSRVAKYRIVHRRAQSKIRWGWLDFVP